MVGVDVGGGFSRRGHMDFALWHAVDIQGPCNKETSPLTSYSGVSIHASVVKPPSLYRKVPSASPEEILLVDPHWLNSSSEPVASCCVLAGMLSHPSCQNGTCWPTLVDAHEGECLAPVLTPAGQGAEKPRLQPKLPPSPHHLCKCPGNKRPSRRILITLFFLEV